MMANDVLLRLKPYTMLPLERLTAIGQLAAQVVERGDLVQCGVFHGGSAAWLWRCAGSNRNAWLFDSFAGLPEPGPQDGGHARVAWKKHTQKNPLWNVGDISKVKAAFGCLEAPENLVHIVPGWFTDTLAKAAITSIAILHIDADWYSSVKQCLDVFYPRLVRGGLVIIDDYGHWPGCRQAVDDYFRASPIKFSQVDYTCVYAFKGSK